MKFRQLYDETKLKLENITPSPSAEARILLEAASGMNFSDAMFGTAEPTQEIADKLAQLTAKRMTGYPLQYLVGKWEFMGRDYYIGEGVLIPRDDTEVVVRQALKIAEDYPAPNIYDLCSGSGIIAITLACSIKDSRVTAVELSDIAFDYLQRNIVENKADNTIAIKNDILSYYKDVPDQSIDILVANPPYIEKDRIPTLQIELAAEPMMALCGGDDGLVFYRAIIDLWTDKIKHGGAIAFEIGETQGEQIKQIMLNKGYTDIRIIKDIQDLDRSITGRRI
ncbi:MAG: peptide chain release factor N(5)-glutamine methyltransferase [Acutalibacteraceae bacterium]